MHNVRASFQWAGSGVETSGMASYFRYLKTAQEAHHGMPVGVLMQV